MKFYIVVFLVFSSLNGKTIETQDIRDICPYIEEGVWIVTDLDNTLFEAKQALGHADWVYDELERRLQLGLTHIQALNEFHPTWIHLQEICEVQPVDESLLKILKAAQQQCMVMGLTQRPPETVFSTLRQVSSLDFNFKGIFQEESFEISPFQKTLYQEGILFVSDYNKKGEVFVQFLQLFANKPKKIIFLDDRKSNIEDMEQTLARLQIPHICVHYTAVANREKIYSRPLADFQLKCLKRILSNEEAKELMRINYSSMGKSCD